MNVIKARQEDRMRKIGQIQEGIKKVFSNKLFIYKDKIIGEICLTWGVSRRTALEYLQIALVQFNYVEFKEEGKICFREKIETQSELGR